MQLEPGEEGASDCTTDTGQDREHQRLRNGSKLFTFRRDTIGNAGDTNISRKGTSSKSHREDELVVPNTKPLISATAQRNNDSKAQVEIPCDTVPACDTLGDIASVLRSKNAGPYEVTFDVMFDSPPLYTLIKNSNLLTTALISKLYSIDEEDVVYCGFFDQAMAFKATIPRMKAGKRSASGGFMENDVHGSGQYLPLMKVQLPGELKEAIQAMRSKEIVHN